MRKAAVLILVAVLAVAAGCGKTGDQPAAHVNGDVITDTSVLAELRNIAANGQFVTEFEQGGSKVLGSTPGSFDPNFAAQVLANQVDNTLVRQEVARRGLQISDECTTAARNNAIVDFGNGTAADGETLFNQFPKPYQDEIVARRANALVLESDLVHQVCGTPEIASAYYANHQDQFARTCLALISVDDQATATDIVSRARGGEDFAALASQYSTDDESRAVGGDIGCHLPDEMPESLATSVANARTGDILDPLDSSNGVVVFKIGTKDTAPLGEVQQVAEELADSDLAKGFRSWLMTTRQDARVRVDPRVYGTFDPAQFTITPPGANTSSTTTPSPTTTVAP